MVLNFLKWEMKMPNHLFHLCGQALTRLPLSIIRLFDYSIISLLLLAFSPLALFAAEKPVTFRGQTIYVDGDPQQIWIGDKTSSDAELVLLYTNYNAAVNSLRTEQKIEARVLVVGGGGAGGYGTNNGMNPGGGGGGGEVKELENAAYEPGILSMTIGAGGA